MTKGEKAIQNLLNKKVMYGNRIVQITGYRIDEERERIYLEIDGKRDAMDRLIYDSLYLAKQFKVVEENPGLQQNMPQNNTAAAAPKLQSDLDAEKLKNILLDNIEKVQKNPEYIKQATAINNQINSFVNITKLQLDYHKAINKMKK